VADSEWVRRVNVAADLCEPGEVGRQIRRADLFVGDVGPGEEVGAHAAGSPRRHGVVQACERRAQWSDLVGVGDTAGVQQNSPSRLPSALGTVEGHYRNGGALRVAVLGTGIMGSAMVRNLVAAGLHTTVWDRTQSAKAPLIEAGVSVGAPRRCAVPRW